MLSRIDEIIFPDRCEVIEIEASHRYIYPIFKNGSTSITEYAKQQGYKILLNSQIKRAPTIDIILRDPLKRFISGFNTFVFNTKRDNPNLDIDTIIYFAETYLFLNRHYAPQIFWLHNLSKYTATDTKLKLRNMDAILEYTPYMASPDEEFILSPEDIDRISSNIDNEVYLRLDKIVMQLVEQSLTYIEILEYIKTQDPIGYLKCIALD